MKKVEPKDLIVGQKYYIEATLDGIDKSIRPYLFTFSDDLGYCFRSNISIYTASEESDIDLKVVVEVASKLYVAHASSEGTIPSNDVIAREAIDLINACKLAVKEGAND